MNMHHPQPETRGTEASLSDLPETSRGWLRRRRTTVSLTAPGGAPGGGPNRPRVSRRIPVPDIPIYPVLSGGALWPGRRAAYPNVLDAGPAAFVRLGRYAISLAFKCLDLRPDDRVLVPAYHCDSMIVPMLEYAAQPGFYRIKDDFRIDLEDLESKIDGRTRAVIATHYFGFHQDVARLRALCDRHGVALIEDCAHAFYGTIDGAPLGSFGDFAIASLWKFFPVLEGGCLVSAKRSLDGVTLRPDAPGAMVRAFVTTLDQARYHGRLSPLAPVHAGLELAGWARRLLSRRRSDGEDPDQVNPGEDGGHGGRSSHFDSRQTHSPLPGFYRNLFTAVAHQGRHIAERRRDNYRHLLERLRGAPGCRPIIADLPDDVVPYMLPLWIDDLPRVFPRLEDAAMPMQRFGQFLWPDVDERTCPVSARYSHQVIQIPCHQELTHGDMESMAETIRRCCARQP